MPIPQNALDLENRNIGMKGRKPQKDTVGEFKNRLKLVVFEFNFLRFYCPKMNSPTVSQSGEKSHRVLSPQPFKAVGGGSRVANRVGDVSMSEVVLDESGVAAFVG